MADNSTGSAKKRVGPGRQFPKGTSGNPGGRPKIIAEVRELARGNTETAINTLVGIASNAEQPAAARVSAAVAILDRGWGRPTVTLSGPDGKPLHTHLTVSFGDAPPGSYKDI